MVADQAGKGTFQASQDHATLFGLCPDVHDKAYFVEQGDVLEVSAGTGRNLPYYRINQLSSLTLTDTSKYMLCVPYICAPLCHMSDHSAAPAAGRMCKLCGAPTH